MLTGAALAGLVGCAQAFPSAWPLVAAGAGALRRAPAQLRCARRAGADLQQVPAARGLRPAGCGARAGRRCVRPGSGGARRRREQAHDEAERIRLRSRRHAPGRPLRHARRAGEHARDPHRGRTRARPPPLPARRARNGARNGGVVAVVLALWALLSSQAVLDAIDATGPGDARVAAIRAARRVAPRDRRSAAPGRPLPPVGVRAATASRSSRPAISARSNRPSAGCPRPTCPTRRRPGSPISGSSRTRPCRSAWQRRVGGALVTVQA